MTNEVAFRLAEHEDDWRFVLKSWIRSYANSPWAGALTRQRQVEAIRGTIGDLLKRGARVVLAVLAKRPTQILGFICFETDRPHPLIHFAYVKGLYRRQFGLGTALVELACEGKEGPVQYTFRTGHKDTPRAVKEGRYRPALARYPRRERVSEDSTTEGLPPDSP